jgi:hypothetical protein
MSKYTRSAPGKQGGVDAVRLSEQEIFMTAYFEGINFAKAKKNPQNNNPHARIGLARTVLSARQSSKISYYAAYVLSLLLGVNGGKA